MPLTDAQIPTRGNKAELETGTRLLPKFDEKGLIACVVTDADSGEVLMVGYMNEESLARTIETGEAWYWSRSRQEYWKKGATSGQIQTVVEMRTDCDQDAILIKVRVSGNGATCHVGYRSCFYRTVEMGTRSGDEVRLKMADADRVYDPDEVYPKGS
ncbi:phosphoribosyl-AMP cyclohydrolase [Breoghania sp. L-A4]|uniref:phosphoribosyl-AMP cyclohydrolase n=1 Tax=Breoghania sp. L-A4 TaxID=2304600 RepID=UPI000E35B2E1|nr:phosphoribosyl-AMP cyclohydrolase [Breoghania sp. L-A4]AXS41099.1 phosphoribosyl-AMP cyclohydrolase [Breoghania sp. L-A4]